MSPPQAASLGTAFATACLALWDPDAWGLEARPDRPVPATASLPVLVYGRSTTVGAMAIQLLRLSGLNPIATCSPHNAELVRGYYGVSGAFDYSLPDSTGAIREASGGRIRHALDCIVDRESVACAYGAMLRIGGRYAGLERCSDELRVMTAKRRTVKAHFVMGPEIFGKEVALPGEYGRPANEKLRLTVKHFSSVSAAIG